MIRISKLLPLLFLLSSPLLYAGTTYNVPAGASTATIQSTLNQAAAGTNNVVLFAAGNYDVTGAVTIPCAAGTLTIQGPSIAWPGPYAATLTSHINGWMFSVPNCSTPVTVQFLNFNGNHPSPDGGGAFYLSEGVSNFTLVANKIWGNSASTGGANDYDNLIWLDGSVNGGTDTGLTIAWNQFGAAGDCGSIMNLYTYQGGTYDAIGGQCAAIGSHVNLTNFTAANNTITQQEQGMKFYEGGSDSAHVYHYHNVNIAYNDLSYIHRIFIEAQADGQNYSYNDVHDPVGPKWGSWGFSTPQSEQNNMTGNLMIENNNGVVGGPGAFEFWGNGLGTGNLVQGDWACAFQWGYFGPSTINGNIMEIRNNCFVNSEEGLKSGAPNVGTNVQTTQVSVHTSTTPTIAVSGTGVVTIANAGPNTTSYYTLDGSTPTPNSTAYFTPFSVPNGTTVKAIGMWGALNQPKSYPAGYGYIPSSIASATSSVSPVNPVTPPASPLIPGTTGTPVVPPGPVAAALTSAFLGTPNSVNSQAAGSTLQFSATFNYSDQTATINTQVGVPDKHGNSITSWGTSAPAVATIASNGQLTGLVAGSTNIQAKLSTGAQSSYWTQGVTGKGPTPWAGSYLGNALSANTVAAGKSLQFVAYCMHVGGAAQQCSPGRDAAGDLVTKWISSNPAILTVSATGVATGVKAGVANVQAMIGSHYSSYWTVTVH